MSTIVKYIVLINLLELKVSAVLPAGIPILLVQSLGMNVVAWDFVTILKMGCHSEGSQLGLVDHVRKLLLMLGKGFETLPTGKV